MMPKTFRVCLFAAVMLCSIALGTDPVSATAGVCPDEADDTFTDDPQDGGPGKLDIIENAHADTSSTITYTLTTKSGFTADDVDQIGWGLDTDSDQDFEGLVIVFGDPLQGFVLNENFNVIAQADVEHTDGEKELTVSFPREALTDIGAGASYDYVVITFESGNEYRQDVAGPCEHKLSGANPDPSPTPTPAPGTLTLNSTQVAQGGTISGTATGLRPASDATVTARSDPVELGRVDSDDQGVADFSFALPSSVAPGTHTLLVRGEDINGNTRVLSAQFEVLAVQPQVASPTPTPQNALPQSGSSIGGSAMMASTLLVVGLTLIAVTTLSRPRAVKVYWQTDPGALTSGERDPLEETAELRLGALSTGGDIVDASRARGLVYASQITRGAGR